jgi:hypothetical protein
MSTEALLTARSVGLENAAAASDRVADQTSYDVPLSGAK